MRPRVARQPVQHGVQSPSPSGWHLIVRPRTGLLRVMLATLPFTVTSGGAAQLRPAAPAAVSVPSSNTRQIRPVGEVDGERLLSNLRDLSVRSWQSNPPFTTVRHLGPTALDFRNTFGLGESDEHIAPMDADGVALAAARALEVRTRTLSAETAALREELRAARAAAAAARRDIAALWSEIATLRRSAHPAGGRRAIRADALDPRGRSR